MTNKELSKWSDHFMFEAEESNADDGPKVFLLSGPIDPLGQIAACAKMYKGEVVRDLRDVTDEERREYLEQIQKTVLKMPLESVQLHFMVEGVTRSFTHQMVRQRTAAFAQESMRFAVKSDAATAVQRPPSLDGTLSWRDLVAKEKLDRLTIGLTSELDEDAFRFETLQKGGAQAWRLKWDKAAGEIAAEYLDLVNDGMPAEDARGLTVHNITTRLNYITNLRSWYDTMAVRVSDQAQFEWRAVAMHMALALREYGQQTTYEIWLREQEFEAYSESEPNFRYDTHLVRSERRADEPWFLVRKSSYWQYEALSNELKPIEFKIGGPAFGANFDRPSRIGERVREFHRHGVPSSEWTKGSVEHGIPPINPEEWLLDPNSARLAAGEEFDIFGNRVPEGTGLHMVAPGVIGRIRGENDDPISIPMPEAYRWPRDFVNDMPHMDNKPGVDESDLEDLQRKLRGE